MSMFAYKAKNGPVRIVSGVVEANNPNDAVLEVLKLGHTPIEIKPIIAKPPDKNPSVKKSIISFNRVPLTALAVFFRQFYDLLDAGVPLLRSVQILAGQKRHPELQDALNHMAILIKDGASLSLAMTFYPKIFSSLHIYMVKSGEGTGNLPEILNRLSGFLEKDLQIRSQIKSALLYPLIILAVGILTLFVLLTFVLPRLMTMFEDFDTQLPWPTVFVMGLSNFFVYFWWLIILLFLVLVYILYRFKQSSGGRKWLDQQALNMPILGGFIREVEISRFARTLGTLLESGVVIANALESTNNVIENVLLKEQMLQISQKVRSGTSLSVAVKASSLFPETAVNMINVGEEGGKLERGLYKLSLSLDRQSQETAGAFITLLGPLVLMVVVGLVGFMVVAMLMPMFQMNLMVQ